jgi:hypothetical protein
MWITERTNFTIFTGREINHIPYADIDDSQESLILLLELLLVENLNC